MTATKTRLYAILLCCVLALLILVPFGVQTVAFAEEATAEEQIIKFEYLKRIEGTPFAEKKQQLIKVPVYANHTIKVNDVKRELKCSGFGVMQSYCDTFEYDSRREVYTAVYYKSVYLKAITDDGKSLNFYLDCNLSFEQYYKHFVNDGIMEREIYDYFINRLHIKYSALDGYLASDIYGYWGLVPVPRSYSLNELFNHVFSGEKTYSGIEEHFVYAHHLEHDAYMRLMEDYGYSWLSRAWATVANWFAGPQNADYYMIYIDSQTTEAFIAENGASDIDDNSGAIFNGIESGWNEAKDWLSKTFKDYKKPITIIGIVALGVLLVALFIRIAFSGIKIERKPKEHKKKNE